MNDLKLAATDANEIMQQIKQKLTQSETILLCLESQKIGASEAKRDLINEVDEAKQLLEGKEDLTKLREVIHILQSLIQQLDTNALTQTSIQTMLHNYIEQLHGLIATKPPNEPADHTLDNFRRIALKTIKQAQIAANQTQAVQIAKQAVKTRTAYPSNNQSHQRVFLPRAQVDRLDKRLRQERNLQIVSYETLDDIHQELEDINLNLIYLDLSIQLEKTLQFAKTLYHELPQIAFIFACKPGERLGDRQDPLNFRNVWYCSSDSLAHDVVYMMRKALSELERDIQLDQLLHQQRGLFTQISRLKYQGLCQHQPYLDQILTSINTALNIATELQGSHNQRR